MSTIRSLDDLFFVSQSTPRILTLFSGGLDSTYVLKELAKHSKAEIICLTVDMGDGVDREDLSNLACFFGAKSIVVDGRASFAKMLSCQLLPPMQNT
jgi:argininosuccinate synthase